MFEILIAALSLATTIYFAFVKPLSGASMGAE